MDASAALHRFVDGDPIRELDAAWDGVWAAVDNRLLGLCRDRTAMLLDYQPALAERTSEELEALASWPNHDRFTATDRAALALTEQYLLDVASVTEAQVAALADLIGQSEAADFMHGLLVVEQRMRLELGLAAVLGVAQ